MLHVPLFSKGPGRKGGSLDEAIAARRCQPETVTYHPATSKEYPKPPRPRTFLTGPNALPWKLRKADMPPQKLTPEIINAAILGFEQQKLRIDAQIAELRAMLSGGPAETAATPEAPIRKRRVSAAARRKMALAQKARWAKIKGESEPPAPATPEPAKRKRKLSKAGKAAIVAALKKRWAAKKAKAKR